MSPGAKAATPGEGTLVSDVVTIAGPYAASAVIVSGALCAGIDATADYTPIMQQRMNACGPDCRLVYRP